MSYSLAVPAAAPPSARAVRDALAIPDLHLRPDDPPGDAWPPGGLRFCRAARSTRLTEVDWRDGELTIVIRALASPDDCDLALRIAETAARLAGAATVEADYFGAVEVGELRRLHSADWMREQAISGTRALTTLIRDGRGPMSISGPNRACTIGARLLAELEAAGPPDTLSDRVLATIRRVQWDVGAGVRDAGVFESAGHDDGGRKTHFAIWLPDEDLVIPYVDYVALRIAEGEVIIVPFAAVAGLAGSHATLLDECQLVVRAMSDDDWKAVIARARPLAKPPRR
ncbi:MAG TPA: hypothetical protein VIF57_23620 [Polyangia bacterium]